jgi:anti-sigma B factor antagonist
MSFEIGRRDDQVVIGVDGQLVARNRQVLKQHVLDLLDRGERRFLIDFSKTGYIDSAGLGVLVSLQKRVRELDGRLRLTHLNDDLRTLFELTRFDSIFEVDGDNPKPA